MRHGLVFKWVLSALALGDAGCGAPPSPQRPTAKVAPPVAVAPPDLPGQGWRPIVSRRLRVAVDLPGRAEWRVNDRTDRWLRAQHPATRSELRLREWAEPSLVDAAACEAQARRWTELPREGSAERVLEQRVTTDAGRPGRVQAWLRRDGAKLTGTLTFFSGDVRSCLSLLYTTEAEGAGAEAAIGSRFGVVATRVVSSARMLEVDDRVRRP